MAKSFLNHPRPLLTVMLQSRTPEVAISRIRNANSLGADAYGFQAENLLPEYQNSATYKRVFAEMKNKPCYVTNYKLDTNKDKSYDELAAGLIELAQSGATLIDVMGDFYCKHPEELTDDKDAINKLHSLGLEINC